MAKKTSKRVKNKKFLIHVTEYRCCLEIYSNFNCQGYVQAHHLLKPYDGMRGMGLKAGDNNAVPLCQLHHAQLHDKHGNENFFWTLFGLSEDFGRQQAKELWENYMEENNVTKKN
tara:strand:- start:490 stop:834 length:345 start_codon:yes stop_codon:yes gene_type:complete